MEHVKPSFKSMYTKKVPQFKLIGKSSEIFNFLCFLSKPRSSIDLTSEILAMNNIKWHNTNFRCPSSIRPLKGNVFDACKTNNKEIWPNKSGSAPEIYVSWLYYRDIKIRDTFVYEYTPMIGWLFILDFCLFWPIVLERSRI